MHTYTLDNFRRIFDEPVYRDVAWRTIRMAGLVTIADAVLAFPIAYYMARVASPRARNLLVVAVLMPLWASYLVKAYAWRTILSDAGVLNWALEPLGLSFDGYSDDGALARVHVPLAAVHDPADLRRARADPAVAARGVRRPRRQARCARSSASTLPLAFPAVVAGSIFTFSLTLGDYIAPKLITSQQFIGTVIYDNHGTNLPVAAAFTFVPIGVMVVYLLVARRLRRVRGALMVESRLTRILLRLGAGATLAFIYLPLVLIALYAFNASVTQSWPIQTYTTKWFSVAYHDEGVRQALWLSVRAALGATAVALVLGTLASLAVSRFAFFGRDAISLRRDPAARAAGDHHRAGAPDDLHDRRDRLRPADDHHRARDVLHRRRLQQLARAPAPRCRGRSRRPRPTSAPTPGRRSAT